MPEIVASGRMPDARACSLCHYPNGKGRPENAGPAGLPAVYIMQQLADFKNDRRASADYRKNNTGVMITIAKAMTDPEIKAAAEYFTQITFEKPWITVKESDTVPKTRIAGGMFLALDGPGTEPIGNRIIEVPENTEFTETLRNPRSGFIAYVPTGSLKKGLQVVMSGANGKTTSCIVCHGEELKGIGPVPGIAGRSPSYIVRQLWDIKAGTRKGSWIDLMKPVADKLTEETCSTSRRTPRRGHLNEVGPQGPGSHAESARQLQHESRSRITAVALGAHRTAVELDEVPNDRQTRGRDRSRRGCSSRQPGGSDRRRRGECRVDADARVADRELDVAVRDLSADIHAPLRRRELDRVGEQIPHHLLEPCRIAHHRARCRIDDDLDVDVLGARSGKDRLDGGIDDPAQIHRRHIQSHLAADHPGHIQEVVDQLASVRAFR